MLDLLRIIIIIQYQIKRVLLFSIITSKTIMIIPLKIGNIKRKLAGFSLVTILIATKIKLTFVSRIEYFKR